MSVNASDSYPADIPVQRSAWIDLTDTYPSASGAPSWVENKGPGNIIVAYSSSATAPTGGGVLLAVGEGTSGTAAHIWAMSEAYVSSVGIGLSASSGGASNGTMAISNFPTNLAQESGGNLAAIATSLGAGGTGIAAPTGGSGVLGWLSGIYSAIKGTLTVSGSVSVANMPVTQAISATALPLPTGAATAAGQAAAQTSLSAIAASLPGALGALTGAASTSFVIASDLANLEPGGLSITGQAMPAGGLGLTGWLSAIYKASAAPLAAGTAHIGGVAVDDVADAAVISGNVNSAAVVVSASTTGFAGGSFQVTATGTGSTITFEQSNDNVNWYGLPISTLAGVGSISPTNTTNALGMWNFVSSAAYIRARVSTYMSGTVTVVLAQKRSVAPVSGISLAGSTSMIGTVQTTGTTTIAGNVNTATGYADSTTALGAAATFTGTGRAFNSSFGPQYSFYNAQAQADQAGTLYIEASYDTGATYIPIASAAAAAVTNAAGTTYYVAQARAPLTGPFSTAVLYRVVYKNGATAQATFRITSSFTAN